MVMSMPAMGKGAHYTQSQTEGDEGGGGGGGEVKGGREGRKEGGGCAAACSRRRDRHPRCARGQAAQE